MNGRKLGLACVVSIFFSNIYASGPQKDALFYQSGKVGWSFVENKGQLSAENGNVKYYSHEGGAHIYCSPGMVRFSFTKTETENQVSEATGLVAGIKEHITTANTDMILKGANQAAEIIATDAQAYFENYYLSGTDITEAHTYKTITYKNIYPHIDMILHARSGGMKYEFAVYPGGNVSDIQLQWKGTDKISSMTDGGMQYANKLAKLHEGKPVSFQNREIISTRFVQKNNTVGFSLNPYDYHKTLIIDPFLEWSTYFGGADVDQASGIATDNVGNVYITGNTKSTSGIADANVYQTNAGGMFDAFVTKFSSLGIKQWSTYFGGTDRENASGIALDAAGNVFITGYTSSTAGIASPGCYQENYIPGNQNNNSNAFIAKFLPNGKRSWGTYFGKGMDNAAAITLDHNGNVLITGTTNTLHNPLNEASILNNNNADVFIAKFSNAGSFAWSVAYGGTSSDNGTGIATDHQGNIYITGQTYSAHNIATPGTWQESFSGADLITTGFIAKFSPNGHQLWGSYYGGNNGARPTGVTTDDADNPYITGYTESTSGIATPGAYQAQYGYAGDAFIAAFTTAGNCRWSTYLGGDGDDKANAIKTDHQGNIYICGNTGSNTSISTPGAWQLNMGGGCNDAFVATFNNSGNLTWGNYYGNRGAEVGYSLALDNKGTIYMTGVTNSGSGVSTPGASQMLDAGKLDAYIVKYKQKDIIVNAVTLDHSLPVNNFTGPQTVRVNITNHSTTVQENVKIGWAINDKTQIPVIYTGKLMPDNTATLTLGNIVFETGKDTIKTWVITNNEKAGNDPDSYVIADTSLAAPNAHFTIKKVSALGHIFMAADTSLTSYKWDFGDPIGNSIFLNYKPVHAFANEETYKVTLTVNNKNGYAYAFDTLINARFPDIDNGDYGNFRLSVFPNPFQSATTIAYNLNKATRVNITMFDISGKEIGLLTSRVQNAGAYQLDMSAEQYHLQPGIYLLKCVFDGEVVTKHVVYGGY